MTLFLSRIAAALRAAPLRTLARRATAAALAALIGLGGAPGPASAESYTVSEGDRLRVTIHGWEDLSGEYNVGPDASIVLPLAGEIEVVGATLQEVRRRVTERLEPLLPARPNAAIEVVGFGPVYVLGAVRSPGSFSYAPGMTVLKAVALAGGTGAGGPAPQGGSVIRAREELDTRLLGLEALLLRQARLRAEAADADSIDPPEDVRAESRNLLLDHEQSLLEVRRSSFQDAIENLQRQRTHFESELEALDELFEAKERETELLRRLLENQRTLLDRGAIAGTRALETESRLIEVERQVVASEGEAMQTRTFISRARQNIGRIEQEVQERRAGRQAQIVEELQAVALELAQSETRVASSERVLVELGETPVADSGPRFRIERIEDGELVSMTATAATRLRPGDVLEVTLESEDRLAERTRPADG